ncbi:membrane-associated oxidoreductase [Streptomyces sp. NPDC048389]|uniref:membrane-associated oxidoreductase n=1 Tax=Streptomyces sp. NPDC048389 TaxID=3154622 RepID=UPI0034516FDE
MEITDLTPAERRVVEAFPRGEGVDFLGDAGDDAGDDAGPGASRGPERTVRAEVLRALLLDGPRQDGEIAGLKMSGARITGGLDLRYGTVNCPVRLRACHFEEAPNLYGAQLRALVLTDSMLPGLTAGNLRVDLALRMSRCRVTGPLRLAGAQVGGAVFLDGARLAAEGGGQAPAATLLSLNHATIGADIWAVGLVVHGETRLNGATVGGRINLDDATLRCPGGTALYGESLSVGADLRAMRLRAVGRIDLTGATVPGQLNLAYARLSNPGGLALRASSCVVGELWLREAAPIEGAVNLRRSQLELLHISPEVWPDQVMIDGLGYGRLAPHLPAEQRLPLLEREQAGYLPFTYEQLATAYRSAGDEAAARTVQFAKIRRHRRTLPWHARVWGALQDVTVGYGFRPMRAAGWLAALLLTGTVAFALNHPPALKPGEAPDFNPAFYTLDLLLPIVGFGQETAYAPQGAYQWLAYLLIIGGWVLATTIAAGVTRSLSRQ